MELAIPLRLEDFVADAISGGNADFYCESPADAQRLLIEFNRNIDSLITTHGIEEIGKAIWYLYGCVGDTARDALDVSVADGAPEFYRSIQDLYDSGFAKYCENAIGHSNRNPNSFATACYMLWDMDSGLNCCTFDESGFSVLASNSSILGLATGMLRVRSRSYTASVTCTITVPNL
jgi:hypothetical protein